MADRVDSSAYACDIDSSLERLMSLARDESPYHDLQDFRERSLLLFDTPETWVLYSCGSLASQVDLAA